ncbi:MAG: phenylalanine--tRNA ligase subunit beta [Bacteroidales bacterium]|nr:phenylalanine--tRNA ligase subunit beta [Bacteroidales bacterium]MCF8402692.1 phenylalanine--tRNA ligase subunit beta [Bacteroidales bacterium]
MKISYNWLKDYLDIKLSPEELSELLTDCGLEVEGLESWQSIKGGMKGMKIGEVKSCVKHPDADRLSVTTVDVGEENLLPIVCGAPNVTAAQKVVVATVGTIIYSGDESFEIKKAKIRGEVSEGMICAEDEIGLGTSHEGIMVLESDAKVGTPASEYFKLEEDWVFEIGLTPNRTDAMSHIGVARDIKAVLENIDFIKGNKNERILKVPSTDCFKTENTNLDIPVIVENPEACPRYTGVTISGIEVKESPSWLKNRLNAIGLRPINNIVDITNYVLHETGQPLHAFDADEITGGKVVVRKMAEGTLFTTLDEVERKLNANDLMICNMEDGMCIGGVFGGIKSGVSEKTTSIFLESAYFDPVHIRKTSKFHDLQTDASFRFERGVDPEMTLYALKRAALLIKQLAGGSISSEIKDVYPKPFEKALIEVSWKNIHRLIGKAIPQEVSKNILTSLDFEIHEELPEGLKVSSPFYRVDVTREADVIEEILRVYGYNNIEIPKSLNASVSHSVKPDPEKIQNVVADFLSNNGFSEIMNNSLTKAVNYENRKDFNAVDSVNILNPLSRDLNVMRQSLLFGGLEAVIYNMNRKNFDLKLYEFGTTYKQNQGRGKVDPVIKRFTENNILALFTTGNTENESWYSENRKTDFYHLKAVCSNLFIRTGIDISSMETGNTEKDYFDFGFYFKKESKLVFEIGKISGNLLAEFDIKEAVYYAEINMDKLVNMSGKFKAGYTEIPKFQEVRRDLALLIDKKVKFEEIKRIAFETEQNLLKQVNLFDVYEGKNIESGKISYAVSFILLDKEKTLTDKVIDLTMNKLMKAYQNKLNAIIR